LFLCVDTCIGGLKATFLASYINTAIIYTSLCIFVFSVYTNPSCGIGTIDNMYHRLNTVSSYSKDQCIQIGNLDACGRVRGNVAESYLTMMSVDGLLFGIINIIGNFGTVFLDQAYWQSAFAANPTASQKGYLMGGLVWFAIPFALATSLGLATVALQLPVTVEEAAEGLVPPAAAYYMLGNSGAILITVMIFMAVTSTGSGELIAVSLLVTYDVYRTYINQRASDQQILYISRCVIICFGLVREYIYR
jgi:Na+/proline symporter